MKSSIRSLSEGWRLAVVLLVLLGLAPLPAVGAEISEQARAEAREKFSEGTEAYERGDFRQALTAFNAAYQLAPLPGFLFNVAQCHRQLGAFERAAFFYKRYLSLSEKEPANAGMVKELIAEMEARAQEEASRHATRQKPAAPAKGVEKAPAPAPTAKASEPRVEPGQDGRPLKPTEPKLSGTRGSRSPSGRKPLPPAAVPTAPASEPAEVKEPLSRKWWVWAGAGAAAVVAGGVIYAVAAPSPREPSLGTITGR
jgi:tetratricopeptide (TPR) repeat protein